jgi:hypothetical protein
MSSGQEALATEPIQPPKRAVDIEGLRKPKLRTVYVGQHLIRLWVGKAQTG